METMDKASIKNIYCHVTARMLNILSSMSLLQPVPSQEWVDTYWHIASPPYLTILPNMAHNIPWQFM
jgi:hypothetical protein